MIQAVGELQRATAMTILENETAHEIVYRLRMLGFKHISLDLEGYVQGSMNPKGV